MRSGTWNESICYAAIEIVLKGRSELRGRESGGIMLRQSNQSIPTIKKLLRFDRSIEIKQVGDSLMKQRFCKLSIEHKGGMYGGRKQVCCLPPGGYSRRVLAASKNRHFSHQRAPPPPF